MTMDNAINSYDGAVSILNGMYASLSTGSGTSIRDYFGGSIYVALSAQAGVARANSSSFYPMSYNSTYAAFSNYWQHWYGCINSANAAIYGISNLPDGNFRLQMSKQGCLEKQGHSEPGFILIFSGASLTSGQTMNMEYYGGRKLQIMTI